ncbi:DUF2194 domain-containing protein [Oceanisphaera sp. IT1-181]|uniref:DUF2194 domain-containing protein n=1 Tax=Oceanisphaera sp. IT1-181 TaxID=3081199 RepID=UPI0029CA9206|nr:DUF2194 domain-containing protein [Oceanisphaera sp. IT1-181]
MSFFAVRDDDTSYHTTIDDLELAYSRWWGEVPISLAVVPFSVSSHGNDRAYTNSTRQDKYSAISENQDLVRYLKEKVKKGHVEIMLHGYTHEYKNVEGSSISECIWKSFEQLSKEVAHGKIYLESLFDTKVKVFVPPSNHIDKDGIRIIKNESLCLSGMMGVWGDRPISLDYFYAWLKRWSWRFFKGYPYPFSLNYDGHSELYAHALNPYVSKDVFLSDLRRASKLNASFVAATHYWAFHDSHLTGELLESAIEEVKRLGMKFSTVSKCMRG